MRLELGEIDPPAAVIVRAAREGMVILREKRAAFVSIGAPDGAASGDAVRNGSCTADRVPRSIRRRRPCTSQSTASDSNGERES